MKRPKNSSAVFRTPCHEHTHKKKKNQSLNPKPKRNHTQCASASL